jgi:hypothetical protein
MIKIGSWVREGARQRRRKEQESKGRKEKSGRPSMAGTTPTWPGNWLWQTNKHQTQQTKAGKQECKQAIHRQNHIKGINARKARCELIPPGGS